MDYSVSLALSFLFVSLCFLKLFFSCFKNAKFNKLPPGPKPLPIFGNIFQLTDKPHNALAKLSKTYGPLMFLKLGSVNTLIVSSADVAREVFSNHDSAFCGRTVPDSVRALGHSQRSMAWIPVSPQWRNLRKISAIQLFTTKSLDFSQSLRQKKMGELLEHVGECCKKGVGVDIGGAGFTTSLNLLSNTFFSIDMASYNSASSQELRDVVWHILECFGKPNVVDFFPLLSFLDPLGIRRDAARHLSKLIAVFDVVISQRLSVDLLESCGKDDVLATLLKISKEDDSCLSLADIKHLLVDLFCGGTDTNSTTIEWAMTELLRNPSKMVKAQAELDQVVGKDGVVEESDIKRLPYLQAIVKETFRLHPPVPLLLPHKAVEDVDLRGYFVPKGTQMLFNVWAIGRDSDTWSNPSEFMPERFLDREINVFGRDFELIPFGAGRRVCPAMPLAYRMTHLMLATLVHSFGWKLEGGMGKDDLDMTEKFGVTLQKAKPLLAVPLPKSEL